MVIHSGHQLTMAISKSLCKSMAIPTWEMPEETLGDWAPIVNSCNNSQIRNDISHYKPILVNVRNDSRYKPLRIYGGVDVRSLDR